MNFNVELFALNYPIFLFKLPIKNIFNYLLFTNFTISSTNPDFKGNSGL